MKSPEKGVRFTQAGIPFKGSFGFGNMAFGKMGKSGCRLRAYFVQNT